MIDISGCVKNCWCDSCSFGDTGYPFTAILVVERVLPRENALVSANVFGYKFFFSFIKNVVKKTKVSMPLSKSFSSDENFIFFSAPDLNVHEPSISYVKSCRAL